MMARIGMACKLKNLSFPFLFLVEKHQPHIRAQIKCKLNKPRSVPTPLPLSTPPPTPISFLPFPFLFSSSVGKNNT